MMYGLCAGGALTRTVEPPYKASVPRCILGPRWVHTAVPSRVRHAACRALRAVRWLLRRCVACNVACCGTIAVHVALWHFIQLLRAACKAMHPACCCCMLHLRVVSVAPGAHALRASQRAACCALRAAVQNAWCVLRRAAPRCAGLQRVACMCSVGERGAHPVGDGPRRLAHAIRRGRDLRRVLFPLPRACAANTWAHPDHVGTGTGLPTPRLHRDCAGPCHIKTGTCLAPAVS
jgi:hypothetical protein